MKNELVKKELYKGFEISVFAEDLDYEDTGFFAEVRINGDILPDFWSENLYDDEDDAYVAAVDFIDEIY